SLVGKLLVLHLPTRIWTTIRTSRRISAEYQLHCDGLDETCLIRFEADSTPGCSSKGPDIVCKGRPDLWIANKLESL
ncbi:hypothetical protein, partial [Vibrio genomosp. F10]|uniref:hypothetical protein n=1 Tax=Vibrio genomosp. F10 TaxID=723171 RepID=UPI001A7E14B2